MSDRDINIVGAGLCGSLLAILLARRGFTVTVFERQADPRRGTPAAGRSINLAMAARGIRALRHAQLFDRVRPLLLPMRGRRVHAPDGSSELQPYGQRPDEVIYSVSRALLSRALLDAADEHGVELRFNHSCTRFDTDNCVATFRDGGGDTYVLDRHPIIAADGAGSMIRQAYGGHAPIAGSEQLLAHGYKELTIPPSASGEFRLDPEALHIWPRGGFMLIALPNPGRDFTATLFLANDGGSDGKPGFDGLQTEAAVEAFFREQFADVVPLIPALARTFLDNPTGILGTVRCRHWTDGERVLLIGDAAHAVVPFHGQGMNAAFEDCRVFDELLGERGEGGGWAALFEAFEQLRIGNANAIADMALENYVEMRDAVRDPAFKLQKALSFELERRLPQRFIPRYSMVMFHDEISYAEAQSRGQQQQVLLAELTAGKTDLDGIDLDAAVGRVCEGMPSL